jgi:hypothetical protein
MFGMIWDRVKVTFLVVLFLSPVGVQVWSKSLDGWFAENHTYPATPPTISGDATP